MVAAVNYAISVASGVTTIAGGKNVPASNQNIAPGFLASTRQTFNPTLSVGGIEINPGFLASTKQSFTPAIVSVFPFNKPLLVSDTNFLTFNGNPVALYGVSNFWVLSDPDVNIATHMTKYAAFRSNFHRCSLIAHLVANRAGLAATDVVHPYQRSATTGANDGGNKFDLDLALNPAWLTRLDALAKESRDNDIVVGLILWDEIPIEAGAARWEYNPFNDDNNINSLGLTGANAVGSSSTGFYNLSNTNLLALQETLATAMLDAFKPYGNLLVWISNEYTGPDAWHQHWNDFVATYNTANSTQFITGGMYWQTFAPTWTDTRSATTNHFPGTDDWDATRPVVHHKSDLKWVNDVAGNRANWWNTICYGAAGQGDDSQDGVDPPDQWLGTGNAATALDQIKIIHDTLDNVSINLIKPEEVGGTINSGNSVWRYRTDEYLGFFEGGGSDTIDLSSATGEVAVNWYDTVNGTVSAGSNIVSPGASELLTSPFSTTDAVCIIKAI